MDYQILDWDSEFFGLKVARITEPVPNEESVQNFIRELKNQNVGLVYCPSTRKLEEGVVKSLGGNLVDIKTTYVVAFGGLNCNEVVSSEIVEPYDVSMPYGNIENLAVQCGEYSRFAVD